MNTSPPDPDARPPHGGGSAPVRLAFQGWLQSVFTREVMAGIHRFAHDAVQEAPLQLAHVDRNNLRNIRALFPHGLDAIISQCFDREMADLLDQTGLPWINLGDPRLSEEAPTIVNDDAAIGALAAEELLRSGVRAVAFVGYDLDYSNQRGAAFEQAVRGVGKPCDTFILDPMFKYTQSLDKLPQVIEEAGRWLAGLETPVGVFACNDQVAGFVVDVCQQFELSVPDQVAVIGVDNDELLCESTVPSLTSIQPDADAIGYAAAGLVADLLAGREPPLMTTIPPVGLVARGTTGRTGVGDEVVAAALDVIGQRACEGISVEDVVAATGKSHRLVQMKFQQVLGTTIADELRRQRIERAKELLRSTDWPVLRIAIETGYSSAAHLSNAFRKVVGETPTGYRARMCRG